MVLWYKASEKQNFWATRFLINSRSVSLLLHCFILCSGEACGIKTARITSFSIFILSVAWNDIFCRLFLVITVQNKFGNQTGDLFVQKCYTILTYLYLIIVDSKSDRTKDLYFWVVCLTFNLEFSTCESVKENWNGLYSLEDEHYRRKI